MTTFSWFLYSSVIESVFLEEYLEKKLLKWKGIQTHERRQERRLGGTGEKTGIGDETGAEPWRGDETGTTGKEKKFKVAMEH